MPNIECDVRYLTSSRIGWADPEVSERVNRPHWQPGPLVFAALVVVGFLYAIGGLLTTRAGTEGWWVNIVAIAMFVPAAAFIEGGWLWVQRQVEIGGGTIVVTRWLDVLRGRRGRPVALDHDAHVAIVTEAGRQLRIERNGITEVNCTLLYWNPSAVRQLLDAFRSANVEVAKTWAGDYPPWAS